MFNVSRYLFTSCVQDRQTNYNSFALHVVCLVWCRAMSCYVMSSSTKHEKVGKYFIYTIYYVYLYTLIYSVPTYPPRDAPPSFLEVAHCTPPDTETTFSQQEETQSRLTHTPTVAVTVQTRCSGDASHTTRMSQKMATASPATRIRRPCRPRMAPRTASSPRPRGPSTRTASPRP